MTTQTQPTAENAAAPPSDIGDSRVVSRLRDSQAALEAKQVPDREALLAAFPQIREMLADCLDAIELVYRTTMDMSDGTRLSSLPGMFEPLGELGDFEILREIGRGGMGIVYEAEQRSLGRRVALKILPFAALLEENQLKRFKNEARAAATLKHPNIVSVYSVGSERGVNYYAMELVEGHSLADVIAALRQGTGDRGQETQGRGQRSEVRGQPEASPSGPQPIANSFRNPANSQPPTALPI